MTSSQSPRAATIACTRSAASCFSVQLGATTAMRMPSVTPARRWLRKPEELWQSARVRKIQGKNMASDADREAIGEVIDGMYRAISGPAGPRDWDLDDRCFHDQARQMRTGVDSDGKSW